MTARASHPAAPHPRGAADTSPRPAPKTATTPARALKNRSNIPPAVKPKP